MPLVERRYAEALVAIAERKNKLDLCQQQLESVAGLYESHGELQLFFASPVVKAGQKRDAIKGIFSGYEQEIVNFLMLLVDKGRIGLLPGILKEYVKLADERRNILNMTIISAAPLEEAQVEKLKEKFRTDYKAANVRAEVLVDSSLIGGVLIRIGDRVVDGTVKGRLENLKESLIGYRS